MGVYRKKNGVLTEVPISGGAVTYDNTTSGLDADNMQEAVDNLASGGSKYGTSSTAAATAAKVVTTGTGDFNLTTGARVVVKFANTDTAGSCTLAVDGTTAKAIYYNGQAIEPGILTAGNAFEFVYDGTNYVMVGSAGGAKSFEMTQAEYDALTTEQKNDPNKVYYITDNDDPQVPFSATATSYDGSESGLEAENVQDALDENAMRFGKVIRNEHLVTADTMEDFVKAAILKSVNEGGLDGFGKQKIDMFGWTSHGWHQFFICDHTTLEGLAVYVFTVIPTRATVMCVGSWYIDGDTFYLEYLGNTNYRTFPDPSGTWVTGETLYRKTIFSTLPDCVTEGEVVSKRVNTGLANIVPVICYGYYTNNYGNLVQMPNGNIHYVCMSDGGISVFNDQVANNGVECKFIVEYINAPSQ